MRRATDEGEVGKDKARQDAEVEVESGGKGRRSREVGV